MNSHGDEKKYSARRAVRNAIRDGILVRPETCSKCGSMDRQMRDGRSSIQAHHYHGYDRPLEVEWLCVRCHREETPAPYGDKSSKAKLTWELVSQLREIYATTGSYYGMARKIGINPTTAHRVVTNRSWPEHASPIRSLNQEESRSEESKNGDV